MECKMTQDCCTPNGNVMILACSGGSNVGKLSNQAAVGLTQEGFARMFLLSGIGGHLSGFVQSATDIQQMVAIDGCSLGCAEAILKHAEIPNKNHLVLTDLGIEKNKDFKLKREDIEKVKKAIREVCNQGQTGIPMAEGGSGSCCG
jgi:uncharacterized metal-binding protein